VVLLRCPEGDRTKNKQGSQGSEQRGDFIMKRYFDAETGNEVFVGTAEEIRALYGSMKRAMKVQHTNYMPLYSDMPKFNSDKQYELTVDAHGFYTVCSNWVTKEPVDKKALTHFIRKEVIKQCKDLTARGLEYFNHSSERDVMINGTVSIQWKKFLKAVDAAFVTADGELFLRIGDEYGVWVKSTDHIHVV
jgi:hypothetical protein